ncbi:MAG: TonB-dependent receptor plug domain-containing protein [Saprospiraceae bacterium]|nr:TonB-dependent receptor plug domain-containing protein [Saprospiraceae bacterium]
MIFRFSLFCLTLFLACQVTRDTTGGDVKSSPMPMDVNAAKLELVDLLRTKPGLEIRGIGERVEITIRGAKSFQGKNAPLYVLDGVVLGRDYKTANITVDVRQVESVRILSPTMAAIYGSRGQNGVIEITSKSTPAGVRMRN